VIPARNAERTIGACLAALVERTPADNVEIVVADNGSTDRTLEIAARYPVRIVRVPWGFVSKVRNDGARVAQGQIVAFVDSDCDVLPHWYEALTSALADPRIGVVGCRHELPASTTWCERAWQAAHVKPGEHLESDVAYVPAGNMALRRDRFLSVGGFDESLETGEDPDLCVRVARRGYRVVSAPAMRCIHHGEPKSLVHVFRRERWHGRGVRLKYSNGRIAPIVLATLLFAALLSLVLAGITWAMMGGPWFLAPAAPAAFLVPMALSVRAAWPVHVWKLVQLWLIYSAYFLGRTAALPVVFARARVRRRAAVQEADA
jgi:glycosyltransferase involved in cell wall biosynthesis